jgi:hypothetical protein
MPVTVISSSATTQAKIGPGYLNSILIAAAGTSWTVQCKDGPDSAGNFKTLLGASAVTVPAVGTDLIPSPVYFGQGLQIVTAGATPGEIDVSWT